MRIIIWYIYNNLNEMDRYSNNKVYILKREFFFLYTSNVDTWRMIMKEREGVKVYINKKA